MCIVYSASVYNNVYIYGVYKTYTKRAYIHTYVYIGPYRRGTCSHASRSRYILQNDWSNNMHCQCQCNKLIYNTSPYRRAIVRFFQKIHGVYEYFNIGTFIVVVYYGELYCIARTSAVQYNL